MKKPTSPETNFSYNKTSANSSFDMTKNPNEYISSLKEEDACQLILDQLLNKKENWKETAKQKNIIQLLQSIFSKLNEKKSPMLNQIISIGKYEQIFKMIFSWGNCFSVFGLINLDFEYSKKLSHNFFVLSNFLINNVKKISASIYLQFFMRISFFVKQKFESIKSSFGDLQQDIKNNKEIRTLVIKQLEISKEYQLLIKLNQFDLDQNNFEYDDGSKKIIGECIHKAMKITTEFPFEHFSTINKNLAVIFFKFGIQNKYLNETKFWNCLVFAVQMHNSPNIILITEMLQYVIKKLIQVKILLELLVNEKSVSSQSTLMKNLQLQIKNKIVESEINFISKIDNLSFYDEKLYNEENIKMCKLVEKCLDSKIFIFKKLITISLNSTYFIEYCIRHNPILGKTNLVYKSYPIYSSLLNISCRLGILVTKHSKSISLNSRYLLKGLEDKKKYSHDSADVRNTIIKIKRAYESVFVFMNEKRKLFNFIKSGRKEVNHQLFTQMQRFIF